MNPRKILKSLRVGRTSQNCASKLLLRIPTSSILSNWRPCAGNSVKKTRRNLTKKKNTWVHLQDLSVSWLEMAKPKQEKAWKVKSSGCLAFMALKICLDSLNYTEKMTEIFKIKRRRWLSKILRNNQLEMRMINQKRTWKKRMMTNQKSKLKWKEVKVNQNLKQRVALNHKTRRKQMQEWKINPIKMKKRKMIKMIAR